MSLMSVVSDEHAQKSYSVFNNNPPDITLCRRSKRYPCFECYDSHASAQSTHCQTHLSNCNLPCG